MSGGALNYLYLDIENVIAEISDAELEDLGMVMRLQEVILKIAEFMKDLEWMLSGDIGEEDFKKKWMKDRGVRLVIEWWSEGDYPYEEDAWWEMFGRELVVSVKEMDEDEEIASVIHEIVEGYLEGGKGWKHEKAHRYAKYVEDVFRRLVVGVGRLEE